MTVFWTIIAVLVGLWLLGMLTSFRMGRLLHGLPIVAVMLVVIRLASGTIEASLDGAPTQPTDREPVVGRLGS